MGADGYEIKEIVLINFDAQLTGLADETRAITLTVEIIWSPHRSKPPGS